MSWIKPDQNIVEADMQRGAVTGIWNALSEAIDELKADTQYLPEELAAKREQEIERLVKALEAGKAVVLGESYRSASKEEGNV